MAIASCVRTFASFLDRIVPQQHSHETTDSRNEPIALSELRYYQFSFVQAGKSEQRNLAVAH